MSGDQPVDLAWQRAGHGVLAHIFTQLNAASAYAQHGSDGEAPAELVSWARGFLGEEHVAAELSLLDENWRVLHSVPVGARGSDIDHLVFGPTGVFAINTKRLTSGLDVNGDAMFTGGAYQRYGQSSILEAARVQEALGTWWPFGVLAKPLLVVVGGSVKIRNPHPSVPVLESGSLRNWLHRQPRVLNQEDVERLYTAARSSAVWAPAMPAAAAPDWVADYARRLGADTTKVPRGARPISRQRARTVASSRGRSSSRKKDSVPQLLVGLVVLLSVAFCGPQLISQFGASLTAKVTATPTNTAYVAPTTLAVKTLGAQCPSVGAKARHPGDDQLMLCLKEGSSSTWQYADPWLRLPIVMQGTRCTVKNSHARARGSDVALVCSGKVGALTWRPALGWRPSD